MFCGCEADLRRPAEHSRLPDLPGPSGRAAGDQREGRSSTPRASRWPSTAASPIAHHLPPEELLLSRPAQGLPDLAVRPAAGHRRASGRGDWRTGAAAGRHHPGAPGGGRRQAGARGRRFGPHRRRRLLSGGLQPGRHAAGRDRDRAGHLHARPGPLLPDPAAQPGASNSGVSDVNMEEGSLRCDANVSVRHPGQPLGTKTELKNMNSFRFLHRGLEAEIERQIDSLDAGRAYRAGDGALRSHHRPGVERCAARKRRTTTGTSPSPTCLPSSWTRSTWSGSGHRCRSCRRRARSGSIEPVRPAAQGCGVTRGQQASGRLLRDRGGHHRRPPHVGQLGARRPLGLSQRLGAGRGRLPGEPAGACRLLGLLKDGTLSGKMAKEVLRGHGRDAARRPRPSWPRRGWARSPTSGALEAIVARIVAANPGSGRGVPAGSGQGAGLLRGPDHEGDQGPGQPATGQRTAAQASNTACKGLKRLYISGTLPYLF